MKKNIVIIVEALVIVLLTFLLAQKRFAHPQGTQLPSDEQLIALAKQHVAESGRYNPRYLSFLEKHKNVDLLDPSKPQNGVTVSEAYRDVTFSHHGWAYDGPRLDVVVRMNPDGSLIIIHTGEAPSPGP